jgi:mono/diheme cytochrome c family protein
MRLLRSLLPTLVLASVILAACAPPASAPAPGADGVIPRPSNPGEPGEAVNLKGDPKLGKKTFSLYCASCHGEEGRGGLQNPGAESGFVPSLNPVDPDMKGPDFAANLDMFIEQGSTPKGSGSAITMPAFGAQGVLTQQQIADVIAYIIGLNP